MRSLGLVGDCDILKFPGGSKGLEKKRIQKGAILLQCLHGFERIILSVHEDCGAGADVVHLHAAAKFLRRKLPCCSVELVFFKLNGTWEIISP
ncbi:MAG: hypothetical protein AAB634_01705 [Patescibacteria group bacterium]